MKSYLFERLGKSLGETELGLHGYTQATNPLLRSHLQPLLLAQTVQARQWGYDVTGRFLGLAVDASHRDLT